MLTAEWDVDSWVICWQQCWRCPRWPRAPLCAGTPTCPSWGRSWSETGKSVSLPPSTRSTTQGEANVWLLAELSTLLYFANFTVLEKAPTLAFRAFSFSAKQTWILDALAKIHKAPQRLWSFQTSGTISLQITMLKRLFSIVSQLIVEGPYSRYFKPSSHCETSRKGSLTDTV